ncbi:MAG: N-acetylmuramoyl-L-alanine amidase [Bacteroidota bacterium]
MNWSISEDHKLSGDPAVNLEFTAVKKLSKGKRIEMPEMHMGDVDTIVIHYTAGSSGLSSARWLSTETVAASAHIVIDRSGQIYQLVPFNRKAWHAGISEHSGRSGFNDFSIGIELDNAGPLTKAGNRYRSSFNSEYTEDEVLKAIHKDESSARFWHKYSETQTLVCEMLCSLLISHYGIRFILGHDEISVGRKIDPGPAFSMDEFRARLLNQDRSESNSFEKFEGTVTATKLNIRQGPGIANKVVGNPLPAGQHVKVVGEHNGWLEVETVIKGWVSKDHVRKNNDLTQL